MVNGVFNQGTLAFKISYFRRDTHISASHSENEILIFTLYYISLFQRRLSEQVGLNTKITHAREKDTIKYPTVSLNI